MIGAAHGDPGLQLSLNGDCGGSAAVGLHLAVQEIADADEARNEGVLGLGVDLVGGADLHDAALLHNGDPVGNGQGLLLVVGDVNGGDAQAALELFDDGAHLHPQLGVQVGKRLVHQKHAGLNDEGAGQGYTLLLAAGELVGLPVRQVGDLHQLQSLGHPGADLILGNLSGLQAVGHIFADRQVGKNGVVLEHHADIPLMGGNVVDALFSEIEIAAFNGVKTGDHTQKCGLAAAGGAQKRKKLSLPDVQGNAVERGKIAVALHRVLDDDLIAHKMFSFCLE